MLDIGQQMDRMRKDGALFHYSRGGRHTNSQTILVFQPITLIWALARTNLINRLCILYILFQGPTQVNRLNHIRNRNKNYQS